MNERRAHPRLLEQARVAVTILSAPDVPDLENRTFFCPTADISIGGLRLSVHTHVPMGAVLVLRIAFNNPLRAFKHVASVVWTQDVEDPRHPFSLGVEFHEGDAAIMEEWREVLEEKLTEGEIDESWTSDGVPPPLEQ